MKPTSIAIPELVEALANQPYLLADLLEQLGLRLTMGTQERAGADLRGVARDIRAEAWV